MSDSVKDLLNGYIVELQNIYGKHLQSVILYGSYARGDFTKDSDVDIMIHYWMQENIAVQIIEHIMAYIMRYQQYMPWMGNHIKSTS